MDKDKISKFYCTNYKNLLTKLTNSKHICKYSDILYINDDNNSISKREYKYITSLQGKKMLYYFKHNIDDIIYIGESHTINDKWSSIDRMKQHFQQSQDSGLLARVMSKDNKSEYDAIVYLNDVDIYYIDLTDKSEYFIKTLESFCIDCYKPKYNK
ncbi:hypothetical protein CHL78_016230 [Romboutsia weinsteinii]|uniref:GIY-YIG domain-containing protein n=1 Tax=Romboutsia weinsteinii TaxID=2020949 RepID=A0A371IZE2_9FIRM|nr:hypothetical protein [Romboutsia weinsteinii]RDY25843.1 hypothetical protein CHL78_016230 [Romboutsia weinsteinii]